MDLTTDQILALRKTLEKQINNIQRLSPIYNKMWPQLQLPEEFIYNLSLIDIDSYILYPIVQKNCPKIPTGALTFVILCESPLQIYCFSHDEILENRYLREMCNGPVNFGHSSLAYISDKKNKNNQSKGDPSHMAKPVLLAGIIKFVEDESPLKGGGSMISWSVESGHYRPSADNANNNRVGYMEKLLPISKFNNIYWKS